MQFLQVSAAVANAVGRRFAPFPLYPHPTVVMLVFGGRVVIAAAKKDTTGCGVAQQRKSIARGREEFWRGTTSLRRLASISSRDEDERSRKQSLND